MSAPQRITKTLLKVLELLLSPESRELHGWEISSQTGIAGPTVYKQLERLAAAGWLEFRWEANADPGKPSRRYYRLTDAGAAEARKLLAERQPSSD